MLQIITLLQHLPLFVKPMCAAEGKFSERSDLYLTLCFAPLSYREEYSGIAINMEVMRTFHTVQSRENPSVESKT